MIDDGDKTYMAIDLKSFYASVEFVARKCDLLIPDHWKVGTRMKYPDYCYYMSGKLRESKTLELIKLLEQYSNEFDYIVGTVNDLKTDEERQTVIDYILHGEDVSYENITLLAFDINLQRQKQTI